MHSLRPVQTSKRAAIGLNWRMEDGDGRVEEGGWRMGIEGRRMEGGGRMEDGGWMEDEEWRVEDGR